MVINEINSFNALRDGLTRIRPQDDQRHCARPTKICVHIMASCRAFKSASTLALCVPVVPRASWALCEWLERVEGWEEQRTERDQTRMESRGASVWRIPEQDWKVLTDTGHASD
jgi:hypothetical protein